MAMVTEIKLHGTYLKKNTFTNLWGDMNDTRFGHQMTIGNNEYLPMQARPNKGVCKTNARTAGITKGLYTKVQKQDSHNKIIINMNVRMRILKYS